MACGRLPATKFAVADGGRNGSPDMPDDELAFGGARQTPLNPPASGGNSSQMRPGHSVSQRSGDHRAHLAEDIVGRFLPVYGEGRVGSSPAHNTITLLPLPVCGDVAPNPDWPDNVR